MRHWVFLVIVLSLVGFLLYSDETTITGQFYSSDTCGEIGCFSVCEFNTDCDGGEECCTVDEGGMCYETGKCKEVVKIFSQKLPVYEQPEKPKGIALSIFSLLLATVIVYVFILMKKTDD
ncbi:hypothetical protein ACFLTH_11075 [Bacteroidota bacterium]